MKYIDFHTHTIYSDGENTPVEVVDLAKAKGLEVLAITDHDHVQGYFDAKSHAKKVGIELLPGSEITTDDYHILGLGVNPGNESFLEFLLYSRNLQSEGVYGEVEELKKVGIPISFEKVRRFSPKARLGSGNIIEALLKDPECKEYFLKILGGEVSRRELYKDYVKRIGKRFTGSKNVEVSDAIKEIHRAGGIAVLAHPFKDVGNMSEVDNLVELGLDGIEIQPNYGEKNIPYEKYARKKGLLITYGSDFHGKKIERPLLLRGENRFDFNKAFPVLA